MGVGVLRLRLHNQGKVRVRIMGVPLQGLVVEEVPHPLQPLGRHPPDLI